MQKRRCSVSNLSVVYAAFVFITISAFPPISYAAATDHGFQMWTPIFLDFPLSRPRLRGYFEANPRLNDGLKGMNQLLIRPAIGIKLNEHLAAYAGYCWVSNYQPIYIQEQRVWQQLGLKYVLFKRLTVLNRLRLEERFIEHTKGSCAMRARMMIRLEMPIKGRWYAVAYDELFLSLNSVKNGPISGIDQNRLFAGIGRQVNKKLRLEIGYQQQYVNRQDPTADKAAHILLTQAFVDF